MNWLISLLFLLLCFTAHGQENWLGQFARQVEQEARRHNLPGYGFAVVELGQSPQIFTYGKTQKNGQPINADTLFRLASVSKTFTGALTAKLVQQGKLDWDMPLDQLAPQYEFDPQQELKLGHILSQSSGYMPNAYDNLIEANYSVQRVLNQLAGLEPICEPGQCYTYQNALFGVLSEGIRYRLDSNYAELLQDNILSPLAMHRVSVGRDRLVSDSNWARPHALVARGQWYKTQVRADYYRFAPAAGINASLNDMVIWLEAMLEQYPHVLSGHTIEQLLTPRIRTKRELYRRHWRAYLKDAHYGLGWRVYDFDGEKLAYHSGWVKGYRADVGIAPDYGVGLVFLMNAESNLMNEISVNFWARLFEEKKMATSMASQP
ncbi:Beta-lactamase [Saliniradius amylolyticus]|uniref:Beta-lactamase n=1 Tax=Saliniradius amylolyticus TaxID=2183582 RepID=A0A2S2E6W0_9ALTE|nr:serine hydrolase domain-containing protein [Saliniradius amylolyticus]AWL13375.1 Beta-lactamase [Saliniradius amylolyticus]